jgi:hypothetical protein
VAGLAFFKARLQVVGALLFELAGQALGDGIDIRRNEKTPGGKNGIGGSKISLTEGGRNVNFMTW